MQDTYDSNPKNTLEQLLHGLDKRQYTMLRTALELGRWPTGKRLTPEEQGVALQAMIVYEHQYLPENQRTGYMLDQCKKHKQPKTSGDEESIIRFQP
ncbi:hypothetical protein CI610_02695 [invertebrate metagenome]|uniref:DUF1315 family protein n=1 Tax=invertebrate metagenome TaxID=1711999 RepID=A0A2H9T586_9ZZZZ